MRLPPPLVLLFGLLSSTLATATAPRSLDAAPVLHFTLTRRGGKFSPTESAVDYVNLTSLVQELEKTEARFNLTKREVKGNKLVRKAKTNDAGGDDSNALMGEVAIDGIWQAPSSYQETRRRLLIHDCLVAGMRRSRLGTHHKKLRWT